MGKKNYTTSSSNIADFIMQDYVDKIKDSETGAIVKQMPLLTSNGYACKISGSSYTDIAYVSEYAVACKFMQKYNPKLKKHRRKLDDYDFGGSENRYARNDKRLFELAESIMEDGEYYCQMGKSSYAVLTIHSDDQDRTNVSWTLYIISKKWKKWKDEFYKIYDKYNDILKKEKEESIRFSDGRASQRTVFKNFDQVVFRDKENILKYIDNWVENIPVYYERYKMVSKLSILLYGDPGTGKSTFAKAVANYLDINSVMVIGPDYFSPNNSESEFSKNRNRGQSFISSSAYKAVYTIDDIDCVCHSREMRDDKENNVTMSNLLQFLDNPPTFFYKAKNGTRYPVSIVIATTNYIDKLDDAVKRYGRFDLKIEMVNFTKKEAQEMCDIYDLRVEDLLPDCNEDGWRVSPSYLQSLCLENIDKSMKEVI